MSTELDDDGWPVISDLDDESVAECDDVIDQPPPLPVEQPSGRMMKKIGKRKKKVHLPDHSGRLKEGDPRTGTGNRRPKKEVQGEGFLKAMRHCMENARYHDRSPAEKLARKLFDDRPDNFIARMHKLELEERTVANPLLATGPDLGHDAACRVLDRLLTEASA